MFAINLLDLEQNKLKTCEFIEIKGIQSIICGKRSLGGNICG